MFNFVLNNPLKTDPKPPLRNEPNLSKIALKMSHFLFTKIDFFVAQSGVFFLV